MTHPPRRQPVSGPAHHQPLTDASLDRYRAEAFPVELQEQGWQAAPEAWQPPAHLRVRVMEAFDHRQRSQLPSFWWKLATAKVRLPLPLAVTTAGLVLSLGTWAVWREPQAVVLTARYPVTGPVQTIPDGGLPLVLPPPAAAPPTVRLPVPPAHTAPKRTPVMRGTGEPTFATTGGWDALLLHPGRLRLFVDDVEVAASSGDESGRALWVRNGATGGFVLSLFPPAGVSAQPAGRLTGKTFSFAQGGAQFRIECERWLVNGSQPLPVWVRTCPSGSAETGFGLGCATSLEQAAMQIKGERQ